MKTKCAKSIPSQFFFLVVLFMLSVTLAGQTVLRGTIVDAETGDPLIGANVQVEGKLVGTLAGIDGSFELTTQLVPPFAVVVSYVGYESVRKEVAGKETDFRFALSPGLLLTSEVVVSASRTEERILESPVTVEKMDPIAIRQTAAPEFYDGISNLKGVQTFQGSLTFTAINTRGFGSNGNERFVQLVDGLDNSAPLLNFPMGNIVGLSELDVHSVELVPGAASALYGPNAFNGILLMRSKNPFDYPGLSVQTKYGYTDTDAGGTHPYYQVATRYAQRAGDRFAFKVNFSYLEGTDWVANDYTTGRPTLATPDPAAVGEPAFDGLNRYGDEVQILLPMPFLADPLAQQLAPPIAAETGLPAAAVEGALKAFIPTLGTLDLRRTGLPEETLLESREANSLKVGGALHYRLTDALEASYAYQFGRGSTVFQGADRYAIRDFTQQYHKLEVVNPDFFVRLYTNLTSAGDSYNLSALGALANERFSPTETEWAPTYAAHYVLGLLPYLMGGAPGEEDIAAAHAFARAQADAGIPAMDSPEYREMVAQVRKDLFQGNPPGAAFVDDSRTYHAEFNYNLSRTIDFAEVQIGGNLRRYDLFSEGTVFNENPDGEGENERVQIDEYGFYTQVSKQVADNRLKLTGSLRYDKNENFDGQVSPRLSAVYSAGPGRQHNFRASFQTGFRNPTTQDQFIFFPLGDVILLGSTEANAGRYGIYQNGAYTNASYQAFLQSGDPGLLEEVDLDYVQPEQIRVFEVGYKGVIEDRLLVDLNTHYNSYSDFIAQQAMRPKEGFTHQGQYFPGVNDLLTGQATSAIGIRPVINVEERLTSVGVGLGLAYELPADFRLHGHYNYASYSVDDPSPDFEARFNMPEHKFLVGLSHRKLLDGRFGFNVNYRWQDAFYWESTFATGEVSAIGVLNAQVNYNLAPLRTTLKVGATNLLGEDYRNNVGGPFIGRMYYLSLTYDQFLN